MQLFRAREASFRIRTQGSGDEFISIIKPRGDTMHSADESSRPSSHHAKAQAAGLIFSGALDWHLAFLSIEAEHSAVSFNISADRKSTRLNSSHRCISYAVFCLKKK